LADVRKETVPEKDGCGTSAEAPRLAEYVGFVLEEARRRNPRLADLDRLAEVLPPRRMIRLPYFVGRWDVA
jgi:hypothetical protein